MRTDVHMHRPFTRTHTKALYKQIFYVKSQAYNKKNDETYKFSLD